MNGNDHPPDKEGDTMTGFTDLPMILSCTLFMNSARLQPLQSGVFPNPKK